MATFTTRLTRRWPNEKYVFADAYSIFGNQTNAGQFDDGNEVFPASGGFYLKANDGRIMVTAAPDDVPAALVQQLKIGGLMAIPVGTVTQELRILPVSVSYVR